MRATSMSKESNAVVRRRHSGSGTTHQGNRRQHPSSISCKVNSRGEVTRQTTPLIPQALLAVVLKNALCSCSFLMGICRTLRLLICSKGIRIGRSSYHYLDSRHYKRFIQQNRFEFLKKYKLKDGNESWRGSNIFLGDEIDETDVEGEKKRRIVFYEKLLNAKGSEEHAILSPKYNMNIYNILDKKYSKRDDNNVLLTVNNLHYEVGSKKLIHNLSFQLHKCECIGLIGNNGCGKTSLLNLIFDNSNNSHKSITINNGMKGIISKDRKINTNQQLSKINSFTDLYKILSYMKDNSLHLSCLPEIEKKKEILYLNEKNRNKKRNDWLFKDGIFYFRQNIHLLGDNKMTVFETVLQFYEETLTKFEVLNYIEEQIDMYQVRGMFDGCTPTGKENNPDIKSSRGRSILCQENFQGKTSEKVSYTREETAFVKSHIFKQILQMYMHEKERIFEELNEIKLFFSKYVHLLNLQNFLHEKLCHLSNGYIIRVYLLLLLLSKVKILLIDEINNNMDIFNIFFIMNVFNYALKFKEVGIILASHDFFLISKLCNRIIDFNKIYYHDIDLGDITMLKKVGRGNLSRDAIGEDNEKYSNLTFFKGRYNQYINNMKTLFENRKKKKEELKRIVDNLSANIIKMKKKNKKDFMQQTLKKKEEELDMYKIAYDTLFNTDLNYQYMYYNLVFGRRRDGRSGGSGGSSDRSSGGSSDRSQHIGKREADTTLGSKRDDLSLGSSNTSDAIEEEMCMRREDTSGVASTSQGIDEEEKATEEDAKQFVYERMKDVDGEMNKNILIDMSRRISNNELVETGEKYSSSNVTLYEFKNFSFYFVNKRNNKKKYIFKNLNLSINSRENVLLLGKNGIGKSTLFKLLTNKYRLTMNGGKEKVGTDMGRSIYAYGGEEAHWELPTGDLATGEEKNYFYEGSIECNYNNVLLTYFEQNMVKNLNKENIYDHFKYIIEEEKYMPISFYENNFINSSLDSSLDNSLDSSLDNSLDSSLDSSLDNSLDNSLDSSLGNSLDNSLENSLNNYISFYYILNKIKPIYNNKIENNIKEKIKSLLKIFYIDNNSTIYKKSGGEKIHSFTAFNGFNYKDYSCRQYSLQQPKQTKQHHQIDQHRLGDDTHIGEEKQNKENYGKHLYDEYDYNVLQFLKTQLEKDKNEKKNYEQIQDVQDEIFEKRKANRKNFGGKGSSGKIKIKNWKRWKK
ncbi:ABC transporter F family member 1, putative (ABCF1) [Plasmodium ovale curtisi]|uniref:ABC transporter F family member 1, putative (ABCF1) n=1 Tax=Plasmodium ovale curtisi TaxID=864141 RepID=A0A1A8W5N6_PLAOA|nr:ABC transporter F family member 1, putative (ABCF1) [Plasmodium ovale curtisi]